MGEGVNDGIGGMRHAVRELLGTVLTPRKHCAYRESPAPPPITVWGSAVFSRLDGYGVMKSNSLGVSIFWRRQNTTKHRKLPPPGRVTHIINYRTLANSLPLRTKHYFRHSRICLVWERG